MNKNSKIIAGGAAALLALGLGVASIGATSAYFSDTNTGGAVTVSLGSIKVAVDGDPKKAPIIEIENLLPGEKESNGFTVENIGKSSQDVYMHFHNKIANAWWNNQGKYVNFEITVDGDTVFKSENLKPEIDPLPEQVLLAEGLAAGDTLDVEVIIGLADWATTQFPVFTPLPYNVIATQPGIAPGA